jgi:hypothetical protein
VSEDTPKVINERIDQILDEEQPVTPPRRTSVALHARRRPPKAWWKSKTIGLHAPIAAQAIIVLVIEFLSSHPDGTVTKAELVALLVSSITIVLRVFTDQPIKGGPKA